MRRTRTGAKDVQLRLPMPKQACGWGGRRAGAGRKKKPGAIVHARRPFHERTHPVHVTVRANPTLGSFRRVKVMEPIMRRLRTMAHDARFAARRRTFRVVEFSVQTDHLHLIVEAQTARALSRGMQGLLAWLARDVNRCLERTGQVFTQRFHARDLKSPLQVRNALVYVLMNAAKHCEWAPDQVTVVRDGIDPCSSARWFSGWRRRPPAPELAPPVCRPTTWLLARGWRRRGPIDPRERPAT